MVTVAHSLQLRILGPLLGGVALWTLPGGCGDGDELGASGISGQPSTATGAADVGGDQTGNVPGDGSGPGPGPGTGDSEGSPTTGATDPTTGGGDEGNTTGGPPNADECADYRNVHPDWIFCDDFETDAPLVGEGRYFEAGGPDLGYTRETGVGYLDSAAMQTLWQPGQVEAGGVKLAFGRNPVPYMNRGIRPNEDFREIWYRIMLKNESGWTGSPAKLSRATVFSSTSDWSQAMIAHLWSDGVERLLLDPASCVQGSTVQCVGYNDFSALDWLGNLSGMTTIFATDASDQWYCVEAHVRLDDPGMANGEQEFWIDGVLEARRDGLAFVKSYDQYAINGVFLENYWNSGSTQEQMRWMDNFVVSTAPIGCP